jgi:alpha-tubulin suppressor-like RCC1 family protein
VTVSTNATDNVGVTRVDLFASGTLICTATAAPWCWGWNDNGELGNGSTVGAPPSAPVAVVGISDAVQVAPGNHHACALRATGQVVCWGKNDHGQLGDGTLASHAVPLPVVGL